MSKFFPTAISPALRIDLIRALLLAVLTVLLWCTLYNRWTVATWQTPITYLEDIQKGDVIGLLAGVRAARDGHLSPFQFTNIPELGAPYTANWDDYPLTEKPLICLMGFLANFIGIFAAANVAVLLGQVLAALSFYAACRILGCSWIWAFAGALIFAFARYFFAHGLHHVNLVYCWHLPLDLVVCEWFIRGEGIRFGDRRLIFALVMAAITGVQNIYYTYMFMQFVLFGGLLQAWRRGWRESLPAFAVIGTAVVAGLLMNLNTIFYQVANGASAGAVVRPYKWLEIYGLKLVDLVVPPPDHSFALFADWGAGHLKETFLSTGEMPPTAYLGLLGLGAVGWLVIFSLRRMVDRSPLPMETWMILWIVLYAEVGGLNSILGVLGFQMFRATTRYSIFILCIALMFAVRHLSGIDFRQKSVAYVLAALGAGIAVWDQSPSIVAGQDLADVSAAVASDRNFTEKIEQRLPANAMIFQIPIMEYPESPAPGVGSYDHLRPYLYSHSLRFSFGSDKGRAHQQWQQDLVRYHLDEIVQRLEDYGFSALYVNRNGFPDKGAALLAALKQIGLSDTIESDKGDLVCILLKPSAQPVLPVSD